MRQAGTLLLSMGTLLFSWLLGPAFSATPASVTLLPAATRGYFSITHVETLAEHWDQTQLGHLTEDPVMRPFVDDFRRQFAKRQASLQKKLGLTLDDLEDVPSGELAVAATSPSDDELAVILLVDVTGNRPAAEALLEKVAKTFLERGAKRSQTRIREIAVTVFDLPEKEGVPDKVAYFLHDGLLAASDNLDELEGVIGRAGGARSPALADSPSFKAVMDRCRADAGELTPQIRWYVEPLSYARALRAVTPKENRRKGKTMLDHLEVTGFLSLRGLGGFIDFSVDGHEVILRTAIHAPKPYEKSMKMLSFPNTEAGGFPKWIPRDVASCVVVNCDTLNAFDNIGPLFDQVVGEGEEGVWPDVLKSLEEDIHGPQIDLRKELVRHFGNRVIVVSDYELPITPESERLLFAIAVNDSEAVERALKKLFKDDEEVRRRDSQGHTIWETIPKETAPVQQIELRLPPLGFDNGRAEEEEEEEGTPLLPNASMATSEGYLLVASHYDFLTRLLKPVDERETLSRSVDFLMVDDTVNQAIRGKRFAQSFSRSDQKYRPTYELIRQGKMPESQTMLGRVLNTFFSTDEEDGLRLQKIDGSKLPEFDYVRRHLGPAGMVGVSEPTGWFFKGFALSKELE